MKVIDLSNDVAGRFAAKLFALAGANVVRPVGDEPADALDIYLDHGKRRLAGSHVDAAALMDGADLVFVSFDRGRVQGLGAALLPLAPADAVRVTTSTYGATGPYAGWRGGPAAAWAAGGYLWITGEPDREPLMGPEHLCGYVTGYSAAIAAEAALFRRRRTGRGCELDISAMESMLCIHQSTFSRLGSGEVRGRTGRFAELYPLTILPCADGYVSLGATTDREFDLLCVTAGCPELLDDPRFATGFSRLANASALDAALAPFLASHTADEVEAMLQAGGTPATRVADPLEILKNPQLAARGYFVDAPGGGRMPGAPLPDAQVFATPRPARAAAAAAAADRGWPLQPRPGDPLPLQGVRVLDLTSWWAGPSCTRTLAELGADVVWVERPNSRAAWENYEGAQAISLQLYEWKMFRHKRSVALDLGTPAGREACLRLAAQADVLVENFRPGVAERLGLGHQMLCARHPGLVYVSLSGFGASGPWRGWGSYGPTIEGASSIMSRTGYAGGGPLRLGHTLPDGIGGLTGAIAALRGLREREARGCGGWFDVSQLEAYVAISGEEVLTASRGGGWAGRVGNRSRQGAIQGVFPCLGEDQWIAIRLSDEDDVRRLAEAAGLPGLVRAAAAWPRDDDAVEAMIAGFTAGWEKQALAEALQAAGLEAFPALTPPDVLADGQVAARGVLLPVTVPGGTFLMPGHPYQASERLADARGAAPTLGQHDALLTD
jgi:crotonobetainyl-CoA:carnitine CoA-transferase CaiB-like acyl-CoA transferase